MLYDWYKFNITHNAKKGSHLIFNKLVVMFFVAKMFIISLSKCDYGTKTNKLTMKGWISRSLLPIYNL